MSSSRSKTLTRVERVEKDAKRRPIKIVQTIEKAQVAIAPTPPCQKLLLLMEKMLLHEISDKFYSSPFLDKEVLKTQSYC
jgi:hypothetical protein